jgi:hypothetical protein
MDGGFFSLEAMTDGPVLQTDGAATATVPKFNFKRTAKARNLAKIAAEDAPPGLTTAQIKKLSYGDFEAHHLFPVQVFEGGEGSQNGKFPRPLLHTARHFGFRK